ncbi:MAG: TM2 domain-containing membrane protein YozV [Halobacteriales archaeon]|jgi:TM2 domain-containing membrane protein YozV
MSDALNSDQVYCRDCGETISERAEICPECGIRQKDPEVKPDSTQNEKDSGLAGVASFLIPGLGQVYNGEIAKGIIAGIVVVALALTGIGLVFAVPMWIWLVYDAYKTAENTGQRSGTTTSVFELSEDESRKLGGVLDWYYENGPSAGLTKRLREQYEKIDTISRLSDTQIEMLLEMVDSYAQEHGTDETLESVREKLNTELQS